MKNSSMVRKFVDVVGDTIDVQPTISDATEEPEEVVAIDTMDGFFEFDKDTAIELAIHIAACAGVALTPKRRGHSGRVVR